MKLKNFFRFLFREFVYGGHLQSLGCVSIIYFSASLLDVKVPLLFFVAFYFIFYPIYLFDRYIGIKKDFSTNPERAEHIKKYYAFSPFIVIISFALAIALLFCSRAGIRMMLFSILVFVLGILYNSIFKPLTRIIPLFKNFYVSLFFSVLVFLPIALASRSIEDIVNLKTLVLAFFIFLNAVLMQIFLDIKDEKSDRREGLKTMPAMIGKENSFSFLKIFSIVFFLFFSVLFLLLGFSFSILLATFTLLFFDFYCIDLASRSKKTAYFFKAGEFILIGFLSIFI